jgi:hypothetical protein
MSFFKAQNGLSGGYHFENAIVLLDASDAGSLEQNANGLTRWRDTSGEQNDVVAAAGGEPAVTADGVLFTGNRSLELAVPFFPSSAQAYTEWSVALLFTPLDQANQYDYAALFAPSETAAGNPNFIFAAGGEWGAAAGGAGFPRIGRVTENVPQLLIISSSMSRQRIMAYCTGTGDTLVFSGSGLDNGVWNFGLGYGIRGRLPLCIFFTEYLTAAKRADLRQQVSAQTGLSL